MGSIQRSNAGGKIADTVVTGNYYRHGTTTLFAVLNGSVILHCESRHRHQELHALEHYLIMDAGREHRNETAVEDLCFAERTHF